MPSQTKPNTAAEIVDEYLRLLMIPNPDAARAGLITQMDVWNDSAEWLIERCGLRTQDHRVAP